MALAEWFIETTGIESVRMLWDSTFDSWAQLGVFSQPAWALFTAGGTLLTKAIGQIDEEKVLETVRSL